MRLTVAAAALLLLAGCGGGGEKETGKAKPTATPTATQAADTMPAAQWSQRVEAICDKASKQAFQAGTRYGRRAKAQGLSKTEFTAGTLLLVAKLTKPWVDKVDAMPRPEGKEQLADDFIGGMRKTAGLLQDTAQALRANDETAGRKAANDLGAAVNETRTQASRLDI